MDGIGPYLTKKEMTQQFSFFFYPVELQKDTEDVWATTNLKLMKQIFVDELKMNPKAGRCQQVNGIVASSPHLGFNSGGMDFFWDEPKPNLNLVFFWWIKVSVKRTGQIPSEQYVYVLGKERKH